MSDILGADPDIECGRIALAICSSKVELRLYEGSVRDSVLFLHMAALLSGSYNILEARLCR